MSLPSELGTALGESRLVVVWADAPWTLPERPPVNRIAVIAEWSARAAALPAAGASLVDLPAVPILTLDPTDRIERAFVAVGLPLASVRTAYDVIPRDRHALLELAGDLSSRRGLILSRAQIRDPWGDEDKRHLLAEAARACAGGAVLIAGGDPTSDDFKAWWSVLVPALPGVAWFAVGDSAAPWPAPIRVVGSDLSAIATALRKTRATKSPPRAKDAASSGEIESLRHKLEEARGNLRLIEERESQYVMSTEVPLQNIKEKRHLMKKIAEIESRLRALGASGGDVETPVSEPPPPGAVEQIHRKLDRLLDGQDGLARGQGALLALLTQGQREAVAEILVTLRTLRAAEVESDLELRVLADGTRQALAELQSRQLPEVGADLRRAIDEAASILRADADVRSGLELSIPLIPLLLEYKISVGAGGGLDFRKLWERLSTRLARNRPGRQPEER